MWKRAETAGSAQRRPELRVERGGGGGHGGAAKLAWSVRRVRAPGDGSAYPLASCGPNLQSPWVVAGLHFFRSRIFHVGLRRLLLSGLHWVVVVLAIWAWAKILLFL